MIVATGASGKLGNLAVDQSAARAGASTVVLGGRNHPGATVLMISSDGPNELRIVQHSNAIEAAKRAGAGRLVYTSFINPGGSLARHAFSNRAGEYAASPTTSRNCRVEILYRHRHSSRA